MAEIVYIRPADGKCSDCGTVKELRPYGKNGAWVCFQCAMKDEEEARRQFGAMIDGAATVVIDARNEPQHGVLTLRKVHPPFKLWREYPEGTRAVAFGGGYWVKVTTGWKWHNGDIFPTPGADVQYIILPGTDQKP